jgi:hypothetical protein
MVRRSRCKGERLSLVAFVRALLVRHPSVRWAGAGRQLNGSDVEGLGACRLLQMRASMSSREAQGLSPVFTKALPPNPLHLIPLLSYSALRCTTPARFASRLGVVTAAAHAQVVDFEEGASGAYANESELLDVLMLCYSAPPPTSPRAHVATDRCSAPALRPGPHRRCTRTHRSRGGAVRSGLGTHGHRRHRVAARGRVLRGRERRIARQHPAGRVLRLSARAARHPAGASPCAKARSRVLGVPECNVRLQEASEHDRAMGALTLAAAARGWRSGFSTGTVSPDPPGCAPSCVRPWHPLCRACAATSSRLGARHH